MRVLQVVPGLESGAGAERSLVAAAPLLIDSGIELHVASFTDRLGLVEELVTAGATFHDLAGEQGLRRRVAAIRRLVRDVEADLVNAVLFEAQLPAQIASLGSSVPVLVTWAATQFDPERLMEGDVGRAKLWAVRSVEALVGRVSRSWYHAVTDGVGRANAKSLRVPSGRVLVGERGRSEDAYRPRQRVPLPAGFQPEDGNRILAVGRQEPQKGYATLLDAFEEVAANDPSVVLYIAGREGRATPDLRRRHDSSIAASRIRFLGARDDMADLLAHADVVVCSSWREGAAGALLEAMASQRPIVSVTLRSLEGVLVDGENARVVPRELLAQGLLEVLHDPELAARLGAGGRRTFLERFTLEASAARQVEIFETVVRESRRPRRAT